MNIIMDLENEFWLKEIQKVARLGNYVYDMKKDIFDCSEIVYEIFGVDSSHGMNLEIWVNTIYPSDRPAFEASLCEIVKNGDDFDVEYRIVNQTDRTIRWLKAKGKLYYDKYGALEKAVGIIQDISELKESEERYKNLYIKFQQKQAFLTSLIDSIPDFFFYKDIDGVYQGCNKAFEVFAGIKEEKLIGKRDLEVFDKETAESFRGRDLEVIRQNKHLRNEEWIKYPDGKVLLVDTLKTPYYDSQGNIMGLIGISRDITEKYKQEELQKSIDEERRRISELEEYDRIKTDFFANISHELRTPTNVIFSALQVQELKLKKYLSKESCTEMYGYTKMMKQNCYRLLRLINNLIDITKIDTMYVEINEVNINIINLIENITMSVADYIEDKGLSLIFDTEVEEKVIACDPEKIERIMLNLLSNAVKFTPMGGNIMVNIEDATENVCIRVKDTGRGIPKEKLNSIFERFVQVDKSFTRDHEGSGIGLSLVKSLVELHGGTISVKSSEGYGTEFIIYIPCKLVDKTYDEIACGGEMSKGYIERINIEFSDIYK
ncbi:sensor histidine kinase [Clostridium cellulovorans]|uniref:histidine kinase n=1 Tax=Clostridium cellulovorans (strain ATCC 35296 / DSM 3052 / OCM 3 / 743B) TaxID=573061 RepID=D9SVA2_CLOC7|nr:PAS domain-containing hybrid sensor histidine kinase/response regulator [Clostridium cellulovorans]ADL53076.1 PAS/PAC sensor signal transduction histidine kinase [Clostridium cellulovorans 743B]